METSPDVADHPLARDRVVAGSQLGIGQAIPASDGLTGRLASDKAT